MKVIVKVPVEIEVDVKDLDRTLGGNFGENYGIYEIYDYLESLDCLQKYDEVYVDEENIDKIKIAVGELNGFEEIET